MKTLTKPSTKKVSVSKKKRGKKNKVKKLSSGNSVLDNAIKSLFKPKD